MARSRPRYSDPSADTRDINRANRFQRENDRRKRDAAVESVGGRPGMSEADQNALASRALGRNRLPVQNPGAAATAARNVAQSPVPLGNQADRNAAGAIAASPVAYQPTSAKLNLGNQRITSGGPAAVDAALQRNIALTQPGGGRGLLSPVAPTERPAAPMVAQAAPGVGKVLPDATGDALFGARPVAGQTNFGTASVRQAQPGEKLAPAVVTANGVQREGPVDRVAMDNQLRTSHPELFVAGSAKNQAFLDHAKRYGVDDAYRNADSLLATVKNETTPAGVSGNREGGVEPAPERVAQLDQTISDAKPPSFLKRVGTTIASLTNPGSIGVKPPASPEQPQVAGPGPTLGSLAQMFTGPQQQRNNANPVVAAPPETKPPSSSPGPTLGSLSQMVKPAQSTPRLPSPVANSVPVSTPAPMPVKTPAPVQETEEEKRKRLMSPVAAL